VRWFAAFLVAVALTGCVSHDLSPDRTERIKTIGVISIMGPMNLEYESAAILFGNHQESEPTEYWRLDFFVVDRVTELLKSRYDVRPVAYDTSTLKVPSPYPGPGGSQIVSAPNLTPLLAQGLDAYVVIVPCTIPEQVNPLIQRRVAFLGLGLLQFQGAIRDNLFAVHAPYVLFVMDGRTGSKIAFEFANDAANWRTVDKSWWADSIAALSEQQKQQTHDALKDLIAKSLPATLQRVKLVP
jgi:hypothetical protein